MKKILFYRNSAIAAFVALSLLAGCIDNEVSPQVEQIRAQQVELMKAKTAIETAVAEYQKAQTAYETARADALVKETAYKAAVYALDLKYKEATTNRDVKAAEYAMQKLEFEFNQAKAQNDIALINNQANLKRAEANLRQAVAELAIAVANAGTAEAKAYYAEYQDKINTIASLSSNKLVAENNLANAKLTAASTTNTWEYNKKGIQISIDQKKITLAEQKASLTTLSAVAADPSTIQAEIDAIEKAIKEQELAYDKLVVDRAKATESYNAAIASYNSATRTISQMDDKTYWDANNVQRTGLKYQLYQVNGYIANATQNISTSEKALADKNLQLTNAKANLTSAENIFNKEKANFLPIETKYNDLQAKVVAATNTDNQAASALTIAEANYNKSVADGASQAVQDALKATRDAAQKTKTDAATALATANTNLSDYSSYYWTAKNRYDNAQTSLTSSQSTVRSKEEDVRQAESTLNSYKIDLADFNSQKTLIEKQITDLTKPYEDAKKALPQYYSDWQKASSLQSELTNKITELQNLINTKSSLKISLVAGRDNINSIKADINNLKTAIASTEKDIANLTNDLSRFDNSKTWADAEVIKLTKELEAINSQIAEAEKLATYYKGLLDKITLG